MAEVIKLSVARDAAVARRAAGNPATLAGAWELFAASAHHARLGGNTREAYARTWRYAARELSETPTTVEVDAWLARRVDRGMSSETAHVWRQHLLIVASRVMKLTGDAGLVRVFADTSKLARHRPRLRLPPDQLVEALLLCAAGNPAELCAVELAAYCGLRVGELLGLQAPDWDRASGVLTVQRSRTQRYVGPRKNDRGGAPAHCCNPPASTAALLTALSDHWYRQRIAPRSTRARVWLAEGWLLPWSPGYPKALRARWCRQSEIVAAWWRRGGGDGWHLLRHWGAAQVYRRTGHDGQALQRWLGDSSAGSVQLYAGALRGVQGSTPAMVAEGFARDRARGGELPLVPRS